MKKYGVIMKYNPKRGFGFLAETGSRSESFFFHVNSLRYDPCRIGDKVFFYVEKSPAEDGKPIAVNIHYNP